MHYILFRLPKKFVDSNDFAVYVRERDVLDVRGADLPPLGPLQLVALQLSAWFYAE